MLANDSNRALLKTRLFFSFISALGFVDINVILDMYNDTEIFWIHKLLQFTFLFTFQLILTYFFLKTKK